MYNNHVRDTEIFKKYIEGKAVKNISLEYNLSTARLRQIIKRAQRKINTFLNEHNIEKPDSLEDKSFWLKQIDAYIKNEYTSINKEVTNVPIEEQSINVLDISNRANNCLHNLLYDYGDPYKDHLIKDLLKYTSDELMKTSNLGKVSLEEIKNALRSKGLFLKEDK